MEDLIIANKVHFINNTDFQTIIVNVYFPYYKEKDNLALDFLLPNMLKYMNNKYPSEEEFSLEEKKRYILGMSVSNMSIGLNNYLVFSMTIPDTYNLKDNYLDKQFELFGDTIYNPKVINDGFDNNEVEREIKNTKLYIDSINKNFRAYNTHMADKLIDDEGILTMSLEYYPELIDNVNCNNLYEHYKKIIRNTPIVLVTGNCDENIINDLCYKYLMKSNNKDIIINNKYFNYLNKYKNEFNYVEEESDFKDSALTFIYKIKDYDISDYKYLYIIRALLCSLSSRLLDKKLRDEYELVYTSSASIYRYYGLFKINTFINKDNKDLVIDKVNEVIRELKDINITSLLIKNIINNERLGLIRELDFLGSNLRNYTNKILGISKTSSEFFDEIKNITSEDIANFIDRFILDTVYFLKEEENDRDN